MTYRKVDIFVILSQKNPFSPKRQDVFQWNSLDYRRTIMRKTTNLSQSTKRNFTAHTEKSSFQGLIACFFLTFLRRLALHLCQKLWVLIFSKNVKAFHKLEFLEKANGARRACRTCTKKRKEKCNPFLWVTNFKWDLFVSNERN